MSEGMSDLEAFARSWAVRVLPGAPLIAPVRQFVLPRRVVGEEEAMGRGAMVLEVRPAAGGSFLATCTRGFAEGTLPTGVWACPAADDLLAVAGGYAYLVPTGQPETAVLLEQRPVTAVVAAREEGLLLLAGFHDVLAVGAEGVRWRTGRLSWEGVTMGGVVEGRLEGMGWDMFADREVGFSVDLATGVHRGGAGPGGVGAG